MIISDVLLKNYTNYKIGGTAKNFASVENEEDIIETLSEWEKTNKVKKWKNPFILGAGTNLLVSEKGFKGLIIHNNIDFIDRSGDILTVGAGVKMPDLLNYCIDNSLSGFEWAGGLPGTVGGGVRGNAGAFSGETKDNLISVKSIDLKTKKEIVRSRDECEFSYRTSIFKKSDNEIIVSAKFKMTPGDQRDIKRKIDEKIEYRQIHHPLEYPNAGSTFKNVPFENIPLKFREEFAQNVKTETFDYIAVARILNLAGLKGERVGEAQISPKHPNYIVNLEDATYDDVKNLIQLAKKTVKEKYGIKLEEEIVYLGGD